MEIPVLLELMESTDSSSDEEIILENLQEIDISPAIRPKIENYINVVKNYSEEQFRQSFRVSKQTAEKLSLKYGQSKFFPRTGFGGGIPKNAYEQTLSFLWFVGNKNCLRDVSERFGIGMSTLFRQENRILDFLVDLAPQIIIFPKSEEQKRQTADEFYKVSGFPNVIGCVDGTSITIKTPANKIKSTYVNRHDTPALILQGICDNRKRFIDVFTGPPGKIHDSRVFKMSFIGKEISHICESEYHLLGDSAYPIRQYLITPYRNYGNLSEQQIKFNKTLSATRVLIENSFGLLKGRWRQLLLLDIHDVDKMTKLIMAFCVLHNLCIDADDLWEEIYENIQNDEIFEEVDTENNLRHLGEIKRDELCNFINH